MCPDFAVVQTGVGQLPVPAGLARQMHYLQHNAAVQLGVSPECISSGFRAERPLRPAPGPRKAQGHHPLPQKRSTAPLPPPNRSFKDLVRQWERLLSWATYKTLTDFSVMPPKPAREASRKVAKRILADYGPNLHKWLGQRTRESTRSGGNTT